MRMSSRNLQKPKKISWIAKSGKTERRRTKELCAKMKPWKSCTSCEKMLCSPNSLHRHTPIKCTNRPDPQWYAVDFCHQMWSATLHMPTFRQLQLPLQDDKHKGTLFIHANTKPWEESDMSSHIKRSNILNEHWCQWDQMNCAAV